MVCLIQAEVSHEMGSVEGSQKAPRKCANETCPLFVFRLGKSPGRAGIGGGRNKKDFDNSSGQNLRENGIVEATNGKKTSEH